MNDRPTEDEIRDAVNTAAGDAWRTVDWTETNSSGDRATLTLELEYIPPTNRLTDPRGQVKDAINALEGEDGAEAWEVVELVAKEYDTDPEVVDDAIDTLRTRGEIYEPKQGSLRTT